MFVLIEISQGIKTFCFKSVIRKTISNFLLLFLEELIWENKISKYYFVSNQIYASLFAKENLYKWFILNEVCITKNLLEHKSLYRDYSLIYIKILFQNPISILDYAHKAL
jgi:hypothetical protein